MAERRPRLGVLPAGAFDLRPGPGGVAWHLTGPRIATASSASSGPRGHMWRWAALGARTGAGLTCM
eukprot:7346684-Alexandrium_andersonii.AAC.1